MQALLGQDTRYKSIYGLFGLFLFVLLFSALGSFAMKAIAQIVGADYQNAISQLQTNNQLGIRNYVRLASIVSQVTTFLLPSLILTYILHKDRSIQFLKLNKVPNYQLIVLGIFFLFATFPIAQWLFDFNKALPLPDWAVSLEKDLGNLSAALLVMESPWELLFNLITIALVPAIGEELLFRGVLQQKIRTISRKPHFSVWMAALIFSAIHGQFEGFLPRLLLGAALGYLLYWTNNLWIPIIAHFFNNALQVTFKYFTMENVPTDTNSQMPALLIVLSITLAVVLAYLLINFNQNRLVQNRSTDE